MPRGRSCEPAGWTRQRSILRIMSHEPPVDAPVSEMVASIDRLRDDLDAYRANVLALASAMLELRKPAIRMFANQDVAAVDVRALEQLVADGNCASGRRPG